MKKRTTSKKLGAIALASLCSLNAQDIPATVQDGLIQYSSFNNSNVGAGNGEDSSFNGPFRVGAEIGTAGFAGGEVSAGSAMTTTDAHIFSGGVENGTGTFEQSLELPGASGVGVRFDTNVVPGTGDFSVSIWFNFQGDNSGGYIVSKGNRGSALEGWAIYVENFTIEGNDASTPNIVFRAGLGGGGDDLRASVSSELTDLDQWHHAVLVIDQVTGVVRGYLDGVAVTGIGGGGPIDETFEDVMDGDGIANVADPVLVGTRINNGGLPVFGNIDDFGMWNRALSEEEITGIYNAGIAGNPLIAIDSLPVVERIPLCISRDPVTGSVTLTWDAEVDVEYAVDTTTTLLADDWQFFGNRTATGVSESLTDTILAPSASSLFYRVRRVEAVNE